MTVHSWEQRQSLCIKAVVGWCYWWKGLFFFFFLENCCSCGSFVPSAGSLTESYDELGNRYQLPAYTLAPPVNLISETSTESKVSESTQKQAQAPPCRQEFQLRVRLSSGKKHPVRPIMWHYHLKNAMLCRSPLLHLVSSRLGPDV